MTRKHWTLIVPGALLCASPVYAVDLRDAVQAALTSNPEIRQAVANKAATREERRQAEGLWLPRVSVEASAGVRKLRNPTRRALGIAGDRLEPVEGQVVVDQLLFDMGTRNAEIRRQASRTDAAAARIEERSEYVALNVSRAYIDYLLQQRLVAIASDNATFHERLAGDLREGVSRGSISIADQQQAEERLQSARARVTEAREDLDTAGIQFQTLTGVPIDQVTMPPDLAAAMPASLAEAEAVARDNNPRVQEAIADLSTAREVVTVAQSELGPRFNLEGTARYGDDIDGFQGRTRDLGARVVMRWKIFDGGTNTANVREQKHRADEAHARLFQVTRSAEEDTRAAWSRLTNQTRLVSELETQSRVSDDLLLSYREQFNVGRRSLLDVLDAQNTRQNVQAQAETARLAKLYAQYRVLAASNRLIEAMGVSMPTAAWSDERSRYRVNPIPASDRQENSIPYPRMGPPDTVGTTTAAAPVAEPVPVEPVPAEPAPAPVDGQ
ncbi:TolC family outer membrane protein [Sphingomonas sp. LY29]|uniref:TolC family outer membrane protein n=1 Tax=Sphingomonas sp. LY29 TaxID=3095341 RepID=UPI002D7A3DAF|nr:TolC family outer membrane protein [Sphingomonas sp. LY29]WRP26984.1 TolC family outer membrane protein [Sphingomonas sp. LY29]